MRGMATPFHPVSAQRPSLRCEASRYWTARPDAAQLQRSADEVARAWEQAIALRLKRLKRNKLIETGGLLEGAAAVGMAR